MDTKITTILQKEEALAKIRQHLNVIDENLILTEKNDTFYIQKSRKNLFVNNKSLDFVLIQFTINENQRNTTFIFSSQTNLISLLFKVLFIPLVWILILVFSISKNYDQLNILVMIFGGIFVSALLYYIQHKSVKLENKINREMQEILFK